MSATQLHTVENPPSRLGAKLAAVMSNIGAVEKRGRNDFHNYNYATADDVMDAARKALSAAGVALITSVEKVDWREKTTKNGGQERTATVSLRFTFTDGNEELGASFVGEGSDSGDKAIQKAITSAHKFFLVRTLHISTGERDDDTEYSGAAPQAVRPARAEKREAVVQQTTTAAKAAAENLASAAEALSGTIEERPSSAMTVPFGKNKGQPITDIDDRSLTWLLGVFNSDLDDDSKTKWHDKTRGQIEQVKAEMKRRGM